MSTLADAVGGPKNVVGGPFGSNLTQKDYVDFGVPVIRGTNMEQQGRYIGGEFAYVSQEKYASQLTPNTAYPGDIIITQRGTLGQVSIVPGLSDHPQFVVSQSQMAIRILPDQCDRDFVYYFLKSPKFEQYLKEATIQVGVPHINLGILRDTPVDWPNLATQKAIVEPLISLDDKIELNRKTNETLEAMAQAIFKDWFVDFGPVRRKIDGAREPSAILGGLLPPNAPNASEIANLFPDRLGDNGLPEGWKKSRLSSLGKVVTGKTPSTKQSSYWGAEVPFLKIPDMHGRMYVLSTKDSLSSSGGDSQKQKYIPAGSISVSCIATPGLVVLNHQTVQTNQQINSIVPYAMDSSLFVFWTCREVSNEVLLGGSGGSVFHNMNKSTFENLEFTAPRDALVRSFVNLASDLHEAILMNEHQIEALADTRDYLLPRLMNGSVSVGELNQC